VTGGDGNWSALHVVNPNYEGNGGKQKEKKSKRVIPRRACQPTNYRTGSEGGEEWGELKFEVVTPKGLGEKKGI